MTPGTRACIAYVAGRIVSGSAGSWLYDHAHSKHVNVGGTVKGHRVGLYDYDRRSNFYGTLPQLWDECTGTSIVLEFNGCRFSGFGTGHDDRFSGWVDGTTITLRDESKLLNFIYTLDTPGATNS